MDTDYLRERVLMCFTTLHWTTSGARGHSPSNPLGGDSSFCYLIRQVGYTDHCSTALCDKRAYVHTLYSFGPTYAPSGTG